jgi:predicted Zn-dependent peptidase
VVVKPEPGSGRVAAVLMVKAGEDDDPADSPGAAALLARLLVQDGAHRAPGRLEATGMEGSLSSLAEPQVTSFSAVTLPAQMPRALRLLNLVLEPPPWDDSAVARALKREEDSSRAEAPTDWERDFGCLQARLGLRGDTGLPGKPPDREVLRNLHRRLYTANRMTLAVVGDVVASEVFDAAQAAFRKMSPAFQKEPPRIPPAPSRATPSGSYAFAGWKAPAATDADAPAVEVIAAALGGGKTGAVFRTLRERDGTGYESGVTYPRRLGSSVLAVYARASSDAAAMRKRLTTLLTEFRKQPPSDWSTARRLAHTAWLLRHQTARDRAYWLAFWETAGLGYQADERHSKALLEVSDDALQAALAKWLSSEPVSVP